MEINNGRFEYRGGEIPVDIPVPMDQVRQRSRAIEGLGGLSGLISSGIRTRACHHPGDQPAGNDVTRRDSAGSSGGAPGAGLARGVSTRESKRGTAQSLFGLVHSHNLWYSMLTVTLAVFLSQSIHERCRRRTRFVDRPRYRGGEYQSCAQLWSDAHDSI